MIVYPNKRQFRRIAWINKWAKKNLLFVQNQLILKHYNNMRTLGKN